MTPKISWFVFKAMAPARAATKAAVAWGVVTMISLHEGAFGAHPMRRRLFPEEGPKAGNRVRPVNFVEEAVEHFSEHRPAPNDRCVILDKEAHGNHFYPEALNGDNFISPDGRALRDSHHVRNLKP